MSLAPPDKLRRLHEARSTTAKQAPASRVYLLYDKGYRSGNQAPWDVGAADLNAVLRGWAYSFAYGTRLMADRAVDHYVSEGVRHFLRRRHQVPSRGTRRFPIARVCGELGVFQLRRLRLAAPAPAAV